MFSKIPFLFEINTEISIEEFFFGSSIAKLESASK